MKEILEGVARFQSEIFPKQQAFFQQLASGQQPKALFLTCSDSRIDPSLITQTEPGELFICRNAGNIVPPHGGVTDGVTASVVNGLSKAFSNLVDDQNCRQRSMFGSGRVKTPH